MKRITVTEGILEGIETDNAFVFKGVPYAKPPLGKLRFMPPEPMEPWSGVRKADAFGAKCFQEGTEPSDSGYGKEFFSNPDFAVPQSEDCLYLNIWIPKSAPENADGFPVAFWIHGGAFINGYSSESEFDGEAFAKRGVIFVSINYRLGILGFLTHPELDRRNGNSGNYGTLDQIAALDWVFRNCSAFGGNPQKITVFGQSAGGMSVRNLISSPLTKGKIAGAIMQSAAGYKGPFLAGADKELVQKAYTDFIEKQGLSFDSFISLSGEELRALNYPFMQSGEKLLGTIFCMGPVAGGYGLPENCDAVLESASEPGIPYMLGCTRDDIFVHDKNTDMKDNVLYQSNIAFARLRQNRPGKVYSYFFTRRLPGDDWGSFHSSELWYVFGTLDRCWRPMTFEDYQLSDRMTDAWTDFAKSGNPGWKECSENTDWYTEKLGF